MNKEELKVRLQIAEGELRDNIDNEQGCFDEIAQRIFVLALNSGLLQEPSSKDVEIQLDKSVHIIHCDEQEYIDGIYLSGTTTEVHFTASSLNGSEIYCYDIEDVEREDILKVLKQLIKMCKEGISMDKKEEEKIYQAYGNAIFNMQNWINVIERGNKLTRKEEIEHLNEALDYFRRAHKQFNDYIVNK